MKRLVLFILSVILLICSFPIYVKAENEQELYQLLLAGNRILKERDFQKEDKPTVYLTFDDGPSGLTNEILEILRKEEIKATFFILGQSAQNHKETLKKIADDGHSIGNHTYSHQYPKLYLSFKDYWTEIQKTEEIIYGITGIRTSLIRTPGGTYKNWDSFYFYYMDQADYLVYDWNADSGDSSRANVPTEEIITQVKNAELKDRIILLMHDSNGHENTVKALPAIIQYYREQGYQFKPITEKTVPLIQPLTDSRWQRENYFSLRNDFVRNVSATEPTSQVEEVKSNDINQKEVTDDISETINNATGKADNYEANQLDKGNENNLEIVDIYINQPNLQKIGEVFYFKEEEEWWIAIDEINRLFDWGIEIDNSMGTIRLHNRLSTFELSISEPFYLVKGNSLVEYQGLKEIDSTQYLPLLPLLQNSEYQLAWNVDMDYLILEKNKNITIEEKNENVALELRLNNIAKNFISEFKSLINWLVTEAPKTFFTYPGFIIYNW